MVKVMAKNTCAKVFILLVVPVVLELKIVDCSFVHPESNYFGSYFQAAGSEFGFSTGTFPGISFPSQAFVPQQISPYPNYWPGWWKPPPVWNNGNELKPLLQSWDTSYSVPCGDYVIHPFVVANVRYSSFQQTISHYPFPSSPSSSSFGHYTTSVASSTSTTSKAESNPEIHEPIPTAAQATAEQEVNLDEPDSRKRNSSRSLEIPVGNLPNFNFQLGPSASCTWNFRAFGACKLKFSCRTFNLPALFRCEENYVNLRGTEGGDLRFCGSRRPRGSYLSTADTLQLYFHSQSPAGLPSAFDCQVLCTLEQHIQEGSNTGVSDIALQTTGTATTSPSSSTEAIATSNHRNKTSLLQQALSHTSAALLNKLVTNALTPPKTTATATSGYKRNLRYLNCKCGIRKDSLSLPVSRIIGGTETVEGEFPWNSALVRIVERNRVFCGATLINDRWLLTAAHCTQIPKRRDARQNHAVTKLKPTIEVLLNPHNITAAATIGNKRLIRAQINRVLVHSNYNSTTFDYDIALLRLVEPIQLEEQFSSWTLLNNAIIESKLKKEHLNSDVFKGEQGGTGTGNKMVPICLPIQQSNLQRTHSQATVTGFGLLKEGGPPSATLMQTQVQIFNHSVCTQLYSKNNSTITQQMLCAGRLNGAMDSCVGDSGGSLVVEQDGHGSLKRHVLQGIVSWGHGCGRQNAPGVYTDVSKFVDWIYANTYLDSNWCTAD